MARSTKKEASARGDQPVAADARSAASGTPQARPADSNDHLDRDRVAARAYELYLARGGAHGADWEDWLAAERELMGGSPVGTTGHHRSEPIE